MTFPQPVSLPPALKILKLQLLLMLGVDRDSTISHTQCTAMGSAGDWWYFKLEFSNLGTFNIHAKEGQIQRNITCRYKQCRSSLSRASILWGGSNLLNVPFLVNFGPMIPWSSSWLGSEAVEPLRECWMPSRQPQRWLIRAWIWRSVRSSCREGQRAHARLQNSSLLSTPSPLVS